MIVLGPKDADLNGAPEYWICGNWRPHTATDVPLGCGFITCPFDKCDAVFEYDARREGAPMPEDQGWKLVAGSVADWQHDANRGVLQFQIGQGTSSLWQRQERSERLPDRAVAHALFMPDESSVNNKTSGLDFIAMVNVNETTRARGIRGTWTNNWLYKTLDGSADFPMVQKVAEADLLHAWHRMALDAELLGPDVRDDNVEQRDGGRTIASLDGYINNDLRHRFGYGGVGTVGATAEFGAKDVTAGRISGWIRNFYASFPGRFLRCGFRAVALGSTTSIRLVFCVEAARSIDDGAAVFLVNYTSVSLGMRVSELPSKSATPAIVDFNSGNAGTTVEARVNLKDLKTGEDVWFTIERHWQHEADKQRATVHLLMIIVEDGTS